LTEIEVQKMATDLLTRATKGKFFSDGWTFGIHRSKRILGQCDFSTKTISVSKYYIDVCTPKQIKQTLLHEAAHFLCDPSVGHGPEWIRKCAELGIPAKRCANYESLKKIPARWTGHCPVCKEEFRAFRKRKNMEELICIKEVCYEKQQFVVWRENLG
jgi:hypothetical protein